MTTVREIQGRIVKALEDGTDPAPILQELAELRAKLATQTAADLELAELQKVADERKALRDRVTAVKDKVIQQEANIAAFLKARDTLYAKLEPLNEEIKALATMGGRPGPCYLYNNRDQFQAAVRRIVPPEDYFPQGFGCSFISIRHGDRNAVEEAGTKFWDILQTLNGLGKSMALYPLRPDAKPVEVDGETADTVGRNGTGSCLVCQHQDRKAIDEALRDGKSLRSIEAETSISRMTLSRHKGHMASLEV